MKLMETQVERLAKTIESQGFSCTDFDIDANLDAPIVRYKPRPEFAFLIAGSPPQQYVISVVPSETMWQQRFDAPSWDGRADSVVFRFAEWLNNIRRELNVAEGAVQGPMPDWVATELPPRHKEVTEQLAVLREEAGKIEAMGRLLWQTGKPLARAVRDVFRAAGFDANLTSPGATYDVLSELDKGRLLVEVTGTSGAVAKASPKIAQILQVAQQEAGDQDRIVLAANIYREKPLGERPQEAVTADALRLISGLGANFVTTATLYGVWKLSLKDQGRARGRIIELHALNGGVFV